MASGLLHRLIYVVNLMVGKITSSTMCSGRRRLLRKELRKWGISLVPHSLHGAFGQHSDPCSCMRGPLALLYPAGP